MICEEGDLETQRLNPENCLTIPHTVDCLQVGRIEMVQMWTVGQQGMSMKTVKTK